MNNLKSKLLTLFLLVVGVGVGITQSTTDRTRAERNPQEMAQRMTKRMAERLELTDTQLAQVAKLNLDLAQNVSELRGKGRTEDGRKAHQELLEAHRSQLQGVLTAEQFAMLPESPRGRGHGRKGMQRGERRNGNAATPEKRAERMVNRLDHTVELTEEQRGRLYFITLQHLKAQQTSREAHRTEVEKLLTDEQLQQLEEQQSKRRSQE